MATITRGVLFVHSATRAMGPHIEWAAQGVLGPRAHFEWTDQPAGHRMFRAEVAWQGRPGTGAALASALRGWEHVRYEVTEDPSFGCDGGRWMHTPSLGIFHAVTDVHGNIVVPEDRIRSVMEAGGTATDFARAMNLALGTAWDEELEPFRYAGHGAPVRWLHRVG
ncbi:DUF3145 domain-containing protein [Demequina sp. NBRC 110054]|uniref:DUF3145 domain-containing protein n=1 Tax=Demequina sp. NBRC 110054 TaxID=1570343 RepID=UPI0009FCFF94|nr:DUF3145 domain-containing protein [Demequina sp. NBRC 110054]